jgi:hypothetical protein
MFALGRNGSPLAPPRTNVDLPMEASMKNQQTVAKAFSYGKENVTLN